MESREPSKEPAKPRRPLPVPGGTPPAQRPNTPVPAEAPTPVPPASFYADPKAKAPPVPARPSGVGSGSTTYVPPSESPPSYKTTHSDYREPELISNTTFDIDDNDQIPPLTDYNTPSANQWWGNQSGTTPYEGWGPQSNASAWGDDIAGWGNGNDLANSFFEHKDVTNNIPIDGRDMDVEVRWWDRERRAAKSFPGPGMLPPVLSDQLHEPEHSLFSVTATPPDIQPVVPAAPTSEHATPKPPHVQPSPEDVRTAVPHPNAYYCPKDNGWVLLSWKSSSVLPPLSRSFASHNEHPLPDQARRKRTGNCIGDEESTIGGPSNKTHHFHKYSKAVDALKLNPPYRMNEWQTSEKKQKRRAGTIYSDTLDLETIKAQAGEDVPEEEEEEGMLLDMYMCCQCSFYCVVSDTLPGAIPKDVWNDYVKDKLENPHVGITREYTLVVAVETLLIVIQNHLWKGEGRPIKVNGPGFSRRLGWNIAVQRVCEALGFWSEQHKTDIHLRAPVVDINSDKGKANRSKLLRAWVEISAWLVDWKRINAKALKDLANYKPYDLWIKIDGAREMYQTAIGAHPDQIPRGELNDTLIDPMRTIEESFVLLGLTPMSYSSELLCFGYLAQCRCDPGGTVEYYTAFRRITALMGNSCPEQIQELAAHEDSEARGRFTSEDLQKATETLGFGPQGDLKVDYDAEIPDEFIKNAWQACVKKTWVTDSFSIRDANQALRIVAQSRGSQFLSNLYEENKNPTFTHPDKAYDVLEIPKDVDDAMLITVFQMRIDEQPMQAEKMQEALRMIAEVRNSERLREFVKTSQDPGEIVAPTRADWPRGINQLGNTCYLNSLLQYFYTIRELRGSVASIVTAKTVDDDKLSDDDLKKHRVGGRLVTRREILRSKRFVGQLADLFHQLEHAENPAVTPTIELAKLALVTSKDEEEDETDKDIDKGGTDSSNDTDATLVEDVPGPSFSVDPPPSSPQSPAISPSVLGKRPRNLPRQDTEVVEPPGSVSPPPSSASLSRESSKLPEASTSSVTTTGDGDVVMRDASPVKKIPPPLPPRKSVNNDSVMMFGKQHDVAECMDNCMFQIETALLKFDGMDDSSSNDPDKTSVVKRLFYGKIRQTFVETLKGQPTTHQKEDLFSHLPVNVTAEGFDIYDGLGRYFDDTIEYETQKVPMEVALLNLPPLLQIQLQRVQFNRELLQSWKSQAFVKFDETIYMDRFMDTADPAKRKKSKLIQDELNGCRERLRVLSEEKHGDVLFSSALDTTEKFLSREGAVLASLDIPLDQDQLIQLNQERDLIRAEAEELRGRIKQLKTELEDIWKDEKNVAYELTSVFIHRGTSPSFGHYFFYSRNLPDKPDEWFKYNDSDVSEIKKEEVLADTTGSTANPYLLVFARKGSEVVETVNRFDPATLVDSTTDDLR